MEQKELSTHANGADIGRPLCRFDRNSSFPTVGIQEETAVFGCGQRFLREFFFQTAAKDKHILGRLGLVHRKEAGNLSKGHFIVTLPLLCSVQRVQLFGNPTKTDAANQRQNNQQHVKPGEIPSPFIDLPLHPLSGRRIMSPASRGLLDVVITKSPLLNPVTAEVVSSDASTCTSTRVA